MISINSQSIQLTLAIFSLRSWPTVWVCCLGKWAQHVLITDLTLCLEDRYEKQPSSSGRMGSLVTAKRLHMLCQHRNTALRVCVKESLIISKRHFMRLWLHPNCSGIHRKQHTLEYSTAYNLTSWEQSLSSEATLSNSCCLNLKVHYFVHNKPSLGSIPRQINSVNSHTLRTSVSIRFTLILSSHLRLGFPVTLFHWQWFTL
jgi:hypothetical protein